MRRGLGILFDVLTLALCGLSLVLAAAATAAWVRSYWVADSAWCNEVNHVRAVVVSRGSLEFFGQRVRSDAPFRIVANHGHRAQPPGPEGPNAKATNTPGAWQVLGFGRAAGEDAFGSRWVVIVPLWAVVAV